MNTLDTPPSTDDLQTMLDDPNINDDAREAITKLLLAFVALEQQTRKEDR